MLWAAYTVPYIMRWKNFRITAVLFGVGGGVYPGLSLPFFHKFAFVSLFLLSFSSFQETHRPLLLIHFHHLIRCGLARDYRQVRQSCEAQCRRREQQPFLPGFFVASPCPVGIEEKLSSVLIYESQQRMNWLCTFEMQLRSFWIIERFRSTYV